MDKTKNIVCQVFSEMIFLVFEYCCSLFASLDFALYEPEPPLVARVFRPTGTLWATQTMHFSRVVTTNKTKHYFQHKHHSFDHCFPLV
jgi:hypothetical protein